MLTPQPFFWHQLTSLRTGLGKLRIVTPHSFKEVRDLPGNLRYRILGNGTNTIGSDEEMPDDEAAIKLTAGPDTQCSFGYSCPDAIHIPAAMPLATALRQSARMGAGGLAALSGIPGTVGGALAMNAGALGHAISDKLLLMTGWNLRTRRTWCWESADGGFAYRTSPIPPDVLVIDCVLRMKPVAPEDELARIDEEIRRRRQANPQGPSAGSVFRNPGDGLPPAGKLLEDCGCKGLVQGNLQVSQQHANWIMNLSGAPASASDARALVNIMRQRVQESFGITLSTEWRWQ